jgi:hypothetical protein
MRTRDLIGATLGLTFLLTPLSGQNVSVDGGTFRISMNGAQVGREEFTIRRIGMGDQARVILRSSIALDLPGGTLNLEPAMDARASDLGVSTYQIKVSGTETTDIYVGLTGSRYQSRVISAAGERLREFRAGPGSVLLDQGVAHQHFLLTQHLDEASAVSVNVLTPRAGRQLRMTLTFVGTEEVRVGDSLFPCRRFHLEGDEGARDVWYDEQGRVLRVEIPSTGYRADRESFS